MPYDSLRWIAAELHSLAEQGLRRQLVERTGAQGARVTSGGRSLVNFTSNDYLALAADPRILEAAERAGRDEGWGAGASPVVSGHSTSQARLEARLAEFLGTEAALIFSSGFAANVGVVGALVGHDDAVFGDAQNHASLIDGCRLSRAKVFVYPHNDVPALREQLRAATGFRRRLIVTDSLFSMEGDVAPLAPLAALAAEHEAMLLVDEAHATGLFGAHGTGLVEAAGLVDQVPVRVGTLSKALASAGGFVAGSRLLIDWLIQRARPYVFSTAHPAAVCAAAGAALDIVRDEPWRSAVVLERAALLRARLSADGWDTGTNQSQIVSLIVGEAGPTMRLAEAMRERGYWTPGIRPPSVAPGKALLRLSVNFGHTPEQIEGLATALAAARAAL